MSDQDRTAHRQQMMAQLRESMDAAGARPVSAEYRAALEAIERGEDVDGMTQMERELGLRD